MKKLKRVILYKHGVGYFESEVQVQDQAQLRLSFKRNQIDDVLKSLMIFDHDGGQIRSISYDTHLAPHDQIQELSIDLSPQDPLKEICRKFRGVAVSLEVGSQEIHGRLLGLETRQLATKQGAATQYLVVVFAPDQGLRQVPLEEIRRFKFDEVSLQEDFQKYLDALATFCERDVQRLVLHTHGQGSRRLSVTYMIATPAWKTSYRILLGEDDGAEHLIQGWALVDNVTEEAWDQVELSLICGLPVSFQHDLATPRFIQRPRLEVAVDMQVHPSCEEAAYAGSLDDEMDSRKEMSLVSHRMGATQMNLADELVQSTQVQTVATQLGQFFEYRIAEPVSVPPNHSAMVPILQAKFQGARLLLYNEQMRAQNPMACIRFENQTGLTLEAGPYTIYSQGRYLGEAMVDAIANGQTRLIPYAVELGVQISKEEQGRRGSVELVRISRGMLHLRRAWVQRYTYRLDNHTNRAYTLIIEHPRQQGYELCEPGSAVSETVHCYRFEVQLPPSQISSFTVQLKRPDTEVLKLENLNHRLLESYIRKDYLDRDISKTLQGLISLYDQMATHKERRKYLHGLINGLAQEQERLRQNLKVLADSNEERELKSRYLAKLAAQEDRVEALHKEMEELDRRIAQLSNEVQHQLQELSFEKLLGTA